MASVIVIAEKDNHELYSFFSLDDNKFSICTLKDALDFTEQTLCDLILLDCGFDVDKGLHLLKELKGIQPQTPIIFLTDLGSEDIVRAV